MKFVKLRSHISTIKILPVDFVFLFLTPCYDVMCCCMMHVRVLNWSLPVLSLLYRTYVWCTMMIIFPFLDLHSGAFWCSPSKTLCIWIEKYIWAYYACWIWNRTKLLWNASTKIDYLMSHWNNLSQDAPLNISNKLEHRGFGSE